MRRKFLTVPNICIAIGLAMLGYGLTLLAEFKISALISIAKWSIGIAVLHDMVWLPLTIAVHRATRRLPRPLQTPISAALAISVAVILVFLPFLLGFGKRPAIPSLLPRNYLGGMFAYLGVVWVASGAAAGVSWWRSRSVAAL